MLGLLGGVHDMGLTLDQRPLEAFLGAVDIEAFAVLARGVEQEAPDVRADVGVLDLDVARLDGVLVAGLLGQILADGAGAEATDILGHAVDQAQDRADDMGGIVHGDHAFPVLGPTVHVLRVGGGHVLDLAQFALGVHVLDEEELAAVDNGFGHHVF